MSNPPSQLSRPAERASCRGISITAALIGNIVALSVLVGSLCAWLVTSMGVDELQRSETERLNETARSIARQVSQAMSERYVNVATVRDLFEQELRSATPQQKRQVMERTRASHKYFSWLGVVSADGLIQIGTGGLLQGNSLVGRDWFEGALKSPVFFGDLHSAKLLDPYIKNPDGAPLYLLDIALPLHGAQGEVTGVLGSHMNWRIVEEVLQHALETTSGTESLSAAIVSTDGTILYDTKGAHGNVESLMQQLTSTPMAETAWPTEADPHYMSAALTPSNGNFPGLGWRIVVRESATVVHAGIERMKRQVITTIGVAGLLFSILGLFAVRTITRPLHQLNQHIQRFGESETIPEAHANYRIMEVRNLHHSFLNMATSVVAHEQLLHETQMEIVKALGRAGEFRDNETGNHVLRMSFCCAHLAKLAGVDDQNVEMIRLASQMHDVGKIGIPDNLLLKPGRFDDAERAIMERHCEIGAQILTGVDTPLIVMARAIAMGHHEKWDGSGYPKRLAGSSTPLEARIAAICDVFDALLSSRPYKQGWPLEQVVDFLREQSGRHFDPELLTFFLAHLPEFIAIRERFRDEVTA